MVGGGGGGEGGGLCSRPMKKRKSKCLLWASCMRIKSAAGRAALRRTILVSDVWADSH